ncbi:MAG: hypothetical protein FJW88_08070 [Actinobacteria bacterium]|nr:hypothetical protein [Actinomycetota bacterium]
MRTLWRAVGAATAGVIGLALLAPDPVAEAEPERARSLLILSLPAVTWADVRSADTPTLDRLLAGSAIADLSTRSVRLDTEPANGYAALGAGSRAVAPSDLAGQNLLGEEDYGDSRADAVFARRTGRSLGTLVGALGFAQLVEENSDQPYDAEPGALGRALREAGISRDVIANADVDELATSAEQLHREAALALIDETGRTPGTVDPELLRADPNAPFGLRLDRRRVLDAFPAEFSKRRTVALVEASDVARADAYRYLSTPAQRVAMRADALASTDRMLAALLERVDLNRDAVLVVGPYHSGRQRELTVAALHAPGVAPGYLESGTTRRAGFLQIVDIAPTALDVLGIDRPDAMEGRPAEVRDTGNDFEGRVRFLVRANRAAVFRDATIGQATFVLIVLTVALALLTLALLRRGLGRATLPWLALGLLGYLVATYTAGALPFDRWGTAAYLAWLLGFAALYAATCMLVARRAPADSLIVGLGVLVTLHGLDALSGAHLELNTVFGYTPTVGIRLAGLGNPASAQLCAAALLLATLLAWRIHGRGGTVVAIGLLGVVLVVVGSPLWGQDFGGAISAAPAFGLLAIMLAERRVTVRSVIGLALAPVVAGLIIGLVDLARTSGERTHVGRFFEKVGNEGPGGFATVVGRKAILMAGTFSNTGWVLLVLAVVVVVAYAIWRTDWIGKVEAWIPTLRPGLISFAVLAVLGTVLNDSGVQVLGMMLAVLLPVLVFLVARAPEPAPAPEVMAEAP